MPVSVIFHDNVEIVTFYVIVNDDEVCSQILRIYHLLREIAIPSLY